MRSLDDIEKDANAATSGPWVNVPAHAARGKSVGNIRYQVQRATADGQLLSFPVAHCSSMTNDRADAEFVSNARTDVPALVARVRVLEAQLRECADRLAEAERELGIQLPLAPNVIEARER